MPFVAVVLAAPLAVIFGALWFFLRGLCAPLRSHRSVWTPRRYRFLSYLLLALAIVGLGATEIVPGWGMQVDEERDFILSAMCAEGKACPLVGNEMNQLRIKLGPLNRYLMTLCQLVTPDPRFTLWTILALHALAAAWLAVAGDRLLGSPFGLIAGLLFGTNAILLSVISAASNGAWASIFQAGAIVGMLQWMKGEQRGLIVAVICLAASCQLHGTNLVFVPPFLFAAAYWRPPISRRSVLLCVIVVGTLYSSWLVYQWETGLSDFSHVSTSWIVSRGPHLSDRLGRAGGPLNGFLAPIALWGVALCAVGRGAKPGDRDGGRLLVLLVAFPLAANVIAGGNWSERYGAPVVAPAALATAAGLRWLASVLPGGRRWERRYGLGMVAAGLGLAAVLSGSRLLTRQEIVTTSQTQLALAEQIEAIRVLGEHGFGAADLESRVHGAAWNRWAGGQVYLGKWLIGATSRAQARQHAVIVECDEAPPDFASWQRTLAAARLLPHLLVGYEAQLSPVRVELSGRSGVFWNSARAAPFYGTMSHVGDADMRKLFDPRLAYPPEFEQLQTRWMSNQPAQMRLRTRLAAGSGDRVVVLAHDTGLDATVTFDGVPRHSAEPATRLGGTIRHHYLATADERGSEIEIGVSIDVPAGNSLPWLVDLHEEPACAADDAVVSQALGAAFPD